MGEIVRRTLADQAYEALHLRIVSGELPAGERLLPDELANTMLISPTPIREALVRLQTEGLVANVGRRGAVVRRFDPKDVTELFEARTMVEEFAVAEALRRDRLTVAAVDEMADIHRHLLAVLGHKTQEVPPEALRLDDSFHGRLVALTSNRVVIEIHRRLMAQIRTFEVYSRQTYPPERLNAEHVALLTALRSRDEPAARAATRTHLIRSGQELLGRMLPDD
jgi:DNA-binding GntR family transcriptional regulator